MGRSMDWRLKASLSCYLLLVIIGISFSFIYLTRSEFMPHHAAAVGHMWSEVDPAFQGVILGLMKIAGAGWLSGSVAVVILVVKAFKQEIRWVFWAIPVIILPSWLVTLYVAVNMMLNTPASPPWEVLAINGVLLLVGIIFSVVPANKTRTIAAT